MKAQILFDTVACVNSAHKMADAKTATHEWVVGDLAQELASLCGIKLAEARIIGQAARVHDIGKIAIPPQVIYKKTPLTVEERKIIESHAASGASILEAARSPLLKLAARIALEHHEYVDGSGYPNGLKGEDISIEARLVCICDVYEALRSPRVYKDGWSHAKAISIMTEGDDRTVPTMFDAKLLAIFLKHQDRFDRIFTHARARDQSHQA